MRIPNSLLVLASMFILFGCKPENVSPNGSSDSAETPSLAAAVGDHPAFGPECSDRITYSLMDESGGLEINYFGPGGVPPTNAGPWGYVDLVNSDTELAIEINLGFGWNIDDVKIFFGSENSLTLSNGIPVSQSSWIYRDIPETSISQILIPLSDLNTPANSSCTDFVVEVKVVKLDFVNGIDPDSETSLWVRNANWDDVNTPDLNTSSAFINTWCVKSCGPVLTTLTDGNCQGCQSENMVVFSDCESVDVSSCKDLSNVVLLFVDNSFEKFDGLSSKSGSFAGTGNNNGRDIARCYVKSGCYKSGDGPGWGLRFDSPCNDDNLISVPGTGGGGKGKGKNK